MENDSDRLEVMIDLDMVEIATKYEVEGLMTLPSESLVSFLEQKWQSNNYRENIASMYPVIHEALAKSFEEQEYVADRMVEILMAYKFKNFKKEGKYTTYIAPNESLDRSLMDLEFRRQIGRYISRGGMFTVELVHALEHALQKSLQEPDWPLEYLEGDRSVGSNFCSWPKDFPVNGDETPKD